MANCTNCSAPLPVNAITCEYCGSRNDVDLRGVHPYTTHAPAADRSCPRCSLPLKTVELPLNGRFLLERCDTCLGLFFDPNELETLLDASVANVYDIDHSRLAALLAAKRSSEYGVSYVKCPVCATLMTRSAFGTRSGVVVDRCKGHGIWLDGGELRQLLEWMKAGGKLLDQQRAAERKREEEVRMRQRQSPAQGVGSHGLDLGALGSGKGPDQFDLIVRALRLIFR